MNTTKDMTVTVGDCSLDVPSHLYGLALGLLTLNFGVFDIHAWDDDDENPNDQKEWSLGFFTAEDMEAFIGLLMTHNLCRNDKGEPEVTGHFWADDDGIFYYVDLPGRYVAEVEACILSHIKAPAHNDSKAN